MDTIFYVVGLGLGGYFYYYPDELTKLLNTTVNSLGNAINTIVGK